MAAWIFFVVSCNGSTSDSQQKPAHTEQHIAPTETASDSMPLILLGSFLNSTTSLSIQQIKEGLSNGSVLVTGNLTETVFSEWGLAKKPQGFVLSSFNHRSDSLFVLTTIDSVTNRFLSISVDSVNFFKEPSKYPLWIQGTGFSYNDHITSYIHTGVTAITRQTGVVLDRITPDEYLANVADYFKKPDLVHISNEVSFMEDCSYGIMRLQFATKKKHFELIKMLGADIVELTGNHNLDFGKEPYLQSLKWYTDNGMGYFGAGVDLAEASKPLVKDLKNGGKVAWVGYNELCPLGECAGKGPGARRYERSVAQQTIDSLRNIAKVDYVIVCIQFGETDSYSPTSSQKRICQEVVELGADVVLGSQAHQAQEIAFHQGKPIFYGLGNFMFDQIHRKGVRQAFFLECYFYKGRIIQFHPVYTFMSDKRIPTPANELQKQEIRSAILKPSNF
ncbi:MAG: CapA family protein [Bacteroidota bacterium]